MRGHLSHSAKDVRKRAWNDAAVCVSLRATGDCESFAGTSLAVCKDSSIISIEAVVDNVLCHLIKDALLLCKHIEDAVEPEIVVIFFDLGVPQTVPGDVEFDLAFIR